MKEDLQVLAISSKTFGETGTIEGVSDGVGCETACALLAVCDEPLAGGGRLNGLEAGDGGLYGFILVLLKIFLGDLFDDALALISDR